MERPLRRWAVAAERAGGRAAAAADALKKITTHWFIAGVLSSNNS